MSPATQEPDHYGCLGTSIKVASGKYVDLKNPDPATIDVYSIASGLGRTCRFGGQCPKFYSVAEHSVLAASLAIDDQADWELVRALLFHDAAEAYIGDVVKPLKLILPGYDEFEDRFEQAISESLGIDFEKHRDEIKHYDRLMLKAEKIRLWPDDKERWQGFYTIENRTVPFAFWKPSIAVSSFLNASRLIENKRIFTEEFQ